MSSLPISDGTGEEVRTALLSRSVGGSSYGSSSSRRPRAVGRLAGEPGSESLVSPVISEAEIEASVGLRSSQASLESYRLNMREEAAGALGSHRRELLTASGEDDDDWFKIDNETRRETHLTT